MRRAVNTELWRDMPTPEQVTAHAVAYPHCRRPWHPYDPPNTSRWADMIKADPSLRRTRTMTGLWMVYDPEVYDMKAQIMALGCLHGLVWMGCGDLSNEIVGCKWGPRSLYWPVDADGVRVPWPDLATTEQVE